MRGSERGEVAALLRLLGADALTLTMTMLLVLLFSNGCQKSSEEKCQGRPRLISAGKAQSNFPVAAAQSYTPIDLNACRHRDGTSVILYMAIDACRHRDGSQAVWHSAAQ